jgi:hypothetical protein
MNKINCIKGRERYDKNMEGRHSENPVIVWLFKKNFQQWYSTGMNEFNQPETIYKERDIKRNDRFSRNNSPEDNHPGFHCNYS